jgi:hypothetical protein
MLRGLTRGSQQGLGKTKNERRFLCTKSVENLATLKQVHLMNIRKGLLARKVKEMFAVW